jgi:hypothetical protein
MDLRILEDVLTVMMRFSPSIQRDYAGGKVVQFELETL